MLYIGILNTINVDAAKNNNFTRSFISGGRLLGDYGVYVVPPMIINKDDHFRQISEICFANIGLESFNFTPLYLRNASLLRFENIRMAEGQPKEDPWIDLHNVSCLRFDIHGDLRADKIKADRGCNNVIIKGTFLQNTDWTQSPFDTLVINPAKGISKENIEVFPHKAFTRSVQPFQMTNVITQNGDLQQIQPTAIPAVTGKFDGLKVLPRILYFQGVDSLKINLNGLREYAPCIYYFFVDSDKEVKLVSMTYGFCAPTLPANWITADGNKNSIAINEAGLYKMSWLPINGVMKIEISRVYSNESNTVNNNV